MSFVRATVLLDGSDNARVIVNPAEIVESGGDVGIMQTATVTLTDAQIKTLPSAPVEIVTAPGEGMLNVLLNITISTHFGVSYVVDPLAAVVIGSGSQSAVQIDDANYSFFSPGSDLIWSVSGYASFFSTRSIELIETSETNNRITLFANNNGLNPFTGGDPANTLKVIVCYTVIDVS